MDWTRSRPHVHRRPRPLQERLGRLIKQLVDEERRGAKLQSATAAAEAEASECDPAAQAKV